MKKFLKIAGILVAVIIIAAIGGMVYLKTAYPKVDPPKDIKIEQTSARIERGKYLAHHVTMCMDCHSVRDWTKFSGPIIPGTEGKGGDAFDESIGFPGRIVVKNITPAAIGNWTDGELARAITCGVNKNGEPIFPIMPYSNFNNLTQEDLFSIVAYIKTLSPKKNQIPPAKLNFPLNFIINTMPLKTYTPAKEVDRNNSVAYGKYLITIASCNCHNPDDNNPLKGHPYAGGNEMKTPLGTIRSANITPDNETGIGLWTKEQFINRFKSFDPDSIGFISVKPGEFNSIMPWTLYSGMSKEDLGAIYDYLRTVKPVKNNVIRFTPPKPSMAIN